MAALVAQILAKPAPVEKEADDLETAQQFFGGSLSAAF